MNPRRRNGPPGPFEVPHHSHHHRAKDRRVLRRALGAVAALSALDLAAAAAFGPGAQLTGSTRTTQVHRPAAAQG